LKFDVIPQVPLFEQRCNATFSAAKRIFRERGDQYGDTWRHSQHLALKAVLEKLYEIEPGNIECQALAAAVLVDVKYQRLEGGWNADHAHDAINYEAFLADAMRELTHQPLNINPQTSSRPSCPYEAHDQVYR
jgi:hypothetical protein